MLAAWQILRGSDQKCKDFSIFSLDEGLNPEPVSQESTVLPTEPSDLNRKVFTLKIGFF